MAAFTKTGSSGDDCRVYAIFYVMFDFNPLNNMFWLNFL